MHLACSSRHCLASNEQKTGRNCSWHDFASSILTSGISALCLYGAIQLSTKHMAGFPASSESSLSPEQMYFCGNFLSEWNFAGIPVDRLLVKIAEYLLNGSPREVKSHIPTTVPPQMPPPLHKCPRPRPCHRNHRHCRDHDCDHNHHHPTPSNSPYHCHLHPCNCHHPRGWQMKSYHQLWR